jgi:hypothetical protein
MDIIKLVRTANTIARNCGSPRSLFFLGPQDSVQVQAFGIHPSLRMAVCAEMSVKRAEMLNQGDHLTATSLDILRAKLASA